MILSNRIVESYVLFLVKGLFIRLFIYIKRCIRALGKKSQEPPSFLKPFFSSSPQNPRFKIYMESEPTIPRLVLHKKPSSFSSSSSFSYLSLIISVFSAEVLSSSSLGCRLRNTRRRRRLGRLRMASGKAKQAAKSNPPSASAKSPPPSASWTSRLVHSSRFWLLLWIVDHWVCLQMNRGLRSLMEMLLFERGQPRLTASL